MALKIPFARRHLDPEIGKSHVRDTRSGHPADSVPLAPLASTPLAAPHALGHLSAGVAQRPFTVGHGAWERWEIYKMVSPVVVCVYGLVMVIKCLLLKFVKHKPDFENLAYQAAQKWLPVAAMEGKTTKWPLTESLKRMNWSQGSIAFICRWFSMVFRLR